MTGDTLLFTISDNATSSNHRSYSDYIASLADIDVSYSKLSQFFENPIEYAEYTKLDEELEHPMPLEDGGVFIVDFFRASQEIRRFSFPFGCTEIERQGIMQCLDGHAPGCEVQLVFISYHCEWWRGTYSSLDSNLIDSISWQYQIHPEILRLHFGCKYGLSRSGSYNLSDEELELSPLIREQCMLLRYGHGFLTAQSYKSVLSSSVSTVVVIARNARADRGRLCAATYFANSSFPIVSGHQVIPRGTNEIYLEQLSALTEQEISSIIENPLDCMTLYGLIALQSEHFWLRYWQSKISKTDFQQDLSSRYSEYSSELSKIRSNLLHLKKHQKMSSSPSPPRYKMLIEATENLASDAEVQLKDLQLMMAYRASLASLKESQLSAKQTVLANQQNQRVKLLTQLAFIFIPLSATASIFGMNLEPLDSGSAKIWMFVVGVVITYVLVILAWLLIKIASLPATNTKLSLLARFRGPRSDTDSEDGMS